MFSKALFKQSCKANGTMWAIITFMECFMLACVMLISGNGNISATLTAVGDSMVKEQIDSTIESRELNYYETQLDGMEKFDETLAVKLSEGLMKLDFADPNLQKTIVEIFTNAYTDSVTSLQQYILEKAQKIDPSYTEESVEFLEMFGCVAYAINPPDADAIDLSGETMPDLNNIKGMFDDFYTSHGEEIPAAYLNQNELFSAYLMTGLDKYFASPERANFRKDRAATCSAIFLAGNLTLKENMDKILAELEKFDISSERFESYGYDYAHVKDVAESTLVTYLSRIDLEIEKAKLDPEAEDYAAKVAEIKTAIAGDISMNFMSSLPEDVASALEELAQLNLYDLVVGSIFFRLAGLLLPIIYMIMVSNNLIAGQVDSGSMAYILSSSTKRQSVVFTQAAFLVLSLLLMFVCTTITSCVCMAIVGEAVAKITYKTMILFNVGAFLVLFTLSGLCFFTSCWFDRSKYSMAIGGGLSIFSLVAAMLGLFGSKMIPSIVRLSALNYFNYATIITLFDTISIAGGTLTYIWKFAILLVLGLIGYVVGSVKFIKKDLPL